MKQRCAVCKKAIKKLNKAGVHEARCKARREGRRG